MELSPLVFIIWVEITVVAFVGLAVLLVMSLAKKGKDKKAVKALFKAIKSDRERRLGEIRESFQSYGLAADEIDKRLRDIDRQELNLYQHIGMLYTKRSEALLKTLNVAHEASTQPFMDLDLSAGNAGSPASAEELEALRSENRRLEEELSVTMETVGRMLSEYSSMFGNEEAEGLDKDRIMESFETDSEDAEQNWEETSADNEMEDSGSADDLSAESEIDVAEDLAPADTDVDNTDDIPDDELLEISDDWEDSQEHPEASIAGESDTSQVAEDIDDPMLGDLDIDSLLDEQAAARNEQETTDEQAVEDELSSMVDIESDLQQEMPDIEIEPDDDDFSDVEIEDMDDIDIEALLNSHLEEDSKS